MMYNFATTDDDDSFLIVFKKIETIAAPGKRVMNCSEVNIYPDPLKDHLMLELPKQHVYSKAISVDVVGEELISMDLKSDKSKAEFNLSTATLAEGIYYVKLHGDHSATLKFIKL